MKKQFAIIGLGRFGSSICKELFKLGHDVLAIDINKTRVDNLANYATHCVVANAIDEKALHSLGVQNFDYVIVAIGDDIQSSILCTLILKEFGIQNVWVKAQNYYHQRVLEKIGADRIIHPEKEMGIRIAQKLVSEKIIDFIELSSDYSIVELKAGKKIVGKTIKQLDVRAKYRCTILGIKNDENINISPSPDDLINDDDTLIVIGHNRDLKRFELEGM